MIELDNDIQRAYVARVEEVVEARRRNGVLLSTFDVIAGASVIFFFTEEKTQMPMKWVFATVRDDLLPAGLLEEVQKANMSLREANQIVYALDEMTESILQVEQELKTFRAKAKELIKEAEAKLDEIKALRAQAIFDPQESEGT